MSNVPRVSVPTYELDKMQRENQRMSQLIDDIAFELGCPEKTSHRHSHGRCIFSAIYELRERLRSSGKEEKNG